MTVLEDRIVQFPNRYKMVFVPGTTDTFDLAPMPGEVTAEGVWVSKQNVIDTANAEAHKIVFEDYHTAAVAPKDTSPEISPYQQWPAGVSFDNRAIFAGGRGSSSSTRYNTITAFDADEVRTNPNTLSVGRYLIEGEVLKNQVVFSHGYESDSVDFFDIDFARRTVTARKATTAEIVSGHTKDYVIFFESTANCDAFDADGVRSTVSGLSTTIGAGPGYLSLSGKFLLTGGIMFGTIVNAIDNDLVITSPLTMASARKYPCCGNIGSYGLIAGGSINEGTSGTPLNIVETIDTDFVRGMAASMSKERSEACFCGNGEKAMIVGGSISSDASLKVVDWYDNQLLRTTIANLKNASGRQLASAIVGSQAIITGNGAVKTDSYYLDGVCTINIPPFHAYKFGEHSSEQFTVEGQSYFYPGKVNGYIKPGNKVFSGLHAQ